MRTRASTRPAVAIIWIATACLALALCALPVVAYAATATVSMKDFSFQPRTVTVRVGDTVTWVNNDTATHTATSSGAWDTGSLSPRSSRSITFTAPGTYLYFCLLHSIMFGNVVVLSQDAPSPTPITVAGMTVTPSTPQPSNAPATPGEVAAAPAATSAVVFARVPSQAGPGPLLVAAAAMAIVALGAFAWMLARQS